jgi:hypothetical protein
VGATYANMGRSQQLAEFPAEGFSHLEGALDLQAYSMPFVALEADARPCPCGLEGGGAAVAPRSPRWKTCRKAWAWPVDFWRARLEERGKRWRQTPGKTRGASGEEVSGRPVAAGRGHGIPTSRDLGGTRRALSPTGSGNGPGRERAGNVGRGG